MSFTTIVYLPAFSFETFFPPFVSVMWKAPSGPVEPTRRGAAAVALVAARTTAVSAAARVRTIRITTAPSRLESRDTGTLGSATVRVQEVAPGLWRWTALHPEWKPEEGWDQEVGCVYYEGP